MSLGWYFHRLRAMGPAELAHRVREKAKKLHARGRLEGWSRYPGADVLPLLGLRERVLAAPASIREDIRKAAETVLAGRFAAAGLVVPTSVYYVLNSAVLAAILFGRLSPAMLAGVPAAAFRSIASSAVACLAAI